MHMSAVHAAAAVYQCHATISAVIWSKGGNLRGQGEMRPPKVKVEGLGVLISHPIFHKQLNVNIDEVLLSSVPAVTPSVMLLG